MTYKHLLKASNALGAYTTTYMRVGGRNIYPPPLCATLQTDGSFYSSTKRSRVAFILQTPSKEQLYKRMIDIKDAVSSTEVEWVSIFTGMEYALEMGQEAINVENDNLGVVGALIMPKMKPKHDYQQYYLYKIQKLAERSAWTGIRWIPREQNKADMLFRI